MKAFAFALLLLAVPAAQAQMYKCVDERGRTRYSDKPFTDCKTKEVRLQSNVAISGPAAKKGRNPPSKEQIAFDQRCAQLRQEETKFKRSRVDDEERRQELREALKPCS